MLILLPLTMIGLGYLIYLLFAGATLALPIALGVATGVGASHLGFAPFTAFILGVTAFLVIMTVSQLAALRLTHPVARAVLATLFAVPAALTGFSLAHALGVMLGTTGLITGLCAAVACAAIAAQRLLRPAI